MCRASIKGGQPHNMHKEPLSAGENVVYRLGYKGPVVAGSHAHFLIFSSHAISFWERSVLWGFAFVWEGSLTTYFPSWQTAIPPSSSCCCSPALLTPSSLSPVALLYLCGISSEGRVDTGCVAIQTCSSCQTEWLPAPRSVSSPRQRELFDLTQRLHCRHREVQLQGVGWFQQPREEKVCTHSLVAILVSVLCIYKCLRALLVLLVGVCGYKLGWHIFGALLCKRPMTH